MGEAGKRIMEGLTEALAIAKGDEPAAGLRWHGHDYEPVQRWQAIETAPKDGTRFLAFYPAEGDEESFIEVTSWTPMPRGMNCDSWTFGGVDPIKWMPLPEPPK